MIKDRILQLAKYKGFKLEDFFKKIGMTYGNFKGKSKETPINSKAIEDILSIIPDVNVEWLLTGKGSMLKGETLQPVEVNTVTKSNVYYIEEPLNAGQGFSYSQLVNEEKSFFMPFLKGKGPFYCFKVHGRSMEDYILEGSFVIGKPVKEKYELRSGHLFIVVTRSEGLMLKRVHFEKNEVILISDNIMYKPFSLPHEEIVEYLTVEMLLKTDFPINSYTQKALEDWKLSQK